MGIDIKPFLRWPGGKRWLVPEIKKLISSICFDHYYEPFLGGGALFFEMTPGKAVLGDKNDELINTYAQVRDNPDEVVMKLRQMKVSKNEYYRIREKCPVCEADRAARFLYLNRTAFSGMYRVNKSGKFNVPFGGGQRDTSCLLDGTILKAASEPLRRARLLVADFEQTLADVEAGDLVYCDPTYTVLHNNNAFVRYNEKNFSWEDQKRLAGICESLSLRGATVFVSNAFHKEVISLYPRARLFIFDRRSLLCPKSSKRKMTKEALFMFRN